MNWFNGMKVGGRLLCGFAVMIAIVAVNGVQGYLSARAIQSQLVELAAVRMPSLDYLVEADRDLQQALVAERSLIFANADSDEFRAMVAAYEENVEQAWTRWTKYKALASSPEELAVIPEFESDWAAWSAISRRVVDGRVADTREGQGEALDLTLGRASQAFETMRTQIDKPTGTNQTISDQAAAAAAAAYTRSRAMQFVMGGFGLLAGTAIAWAIRRSIVGPLGKLIEGLALSSAQLTSASGQVAAASQVLAEGSSTQAAAIEETSASLEEMSSMTQQNAASAQDADQLMKQTNAVVQTANEEMQGLDTSMREISQASAETQKIVKTIDEIAFQTNLLALNAAVEAARAGEAGAGFAVVAEEVRNLAGRAAEASRNTAGLIDETVRKIEAGAQLVGRTNQAFAEVSANAARVGTLVSNIASASNEQAQGIAQVAQAVTGMDQVTQSNAASAEESASAAQQMSAQAEHMLVYVADLEQLVGGNGHRTPYAAAPAPAPVAAPRRVRSKPTPAATSPEVVIPLTAEDEFVDLRV